MVTVKQYQPGFYKHRVKQDATDGKVNVKAYQFKVEEE